MDIENANGLEDLYTEAMTLVFPGSRMSIVSATIIILNMCSVFRVSNNFNDELLRFLSTDLLPIGNKLPTMHYKARRSIGRLDLQYNNIHACSRATQSM